jgi:hypothetical protein
MKRRCVSLAFLAILAAAVVVPAEAAVTEDQFQVRTTGDLLALCSVAPADPLRTASINFCHGFGVGVYQVLQEQAAARPSMRFFCVPEPTPSRNDAIAGFVQWARAHPGEMSQLPADGLARFLAQQYPCPSTR